ncbi:hypothetical protein EIN_093450 [Entamoeba invadens IP1]|uniref:Uncharacterized protein n=1 Tax=Entamoeba invadens IP1 TaxID=370355 RepID=A0A0A1U370_ENTIV|nr:hypothetical protein EIN_093450 [Entamoeba invadens IP1]ELP87188.1 hypothetical protein EIN_093450 [Entamoeba invadens IP1]|eukprot:XP_004253959.1 hypothetical protein EIN_093450 [Entamoeba invadens IP1]
MKVILFVLLIITLSQGKRKSKKRESPPNNKQKKENKGQLTTTRKTGKSVQISGKGKKGSLSIKAERRDKNTRSTSVGGSVNLNKAVTVTGSVSKQTTKTPKGVSRTTNTKIGTTVRPTKRTQVRGSVERRETNGKRTHSYSAGVAVNPTKNSEVAVDYTKGHDGRSGVKVSGKIKRGRVEAAGSVEMGKRRGYSGSVAYETKRGTRIEGSVSSSNAGKKRETTVGGKVSTKIGKKGSGYIGVSHGTSSGTQIEAGYRHQFNDRLSANVGGFHNSKTGTGASAGLSWTF